jgi:hypothetical protein
MTKVNQLVLEVLFVPLPVAEMEERRERLRLLLLRGAIRAARYQLLDNVSVPDSMCTELAQK